MNTAAAIVLGCVAIYESAVAMERHRRRTTVYEQAMARAQALGRPLIVVGDPDAGCHTTFKRAYDCGDVCVDLAGCAACPVDVAADITKPLPFEPDSAVIYVSCVLEYVDDAPAAVRELVRVAGTQENLFIVDVDPDSLTALLYPGANWRAGRSGYRRVTGVHKIAAVGGLAYLLWTVGK